jgi:hypothetical protein
MTRSCRGLQRWRLRQGLVDSTINMNKTAKEYSALQTEDSAHETVGTSICSAWKVAPKTVWVQTRSPQLAKKLKQVGGYKEVAFGVLGGYLRTFEFKKSLAWARSWIARHTAANEAFLDLPSPQSDPDHSNRSLKGSKRSNAYKPEPASFSEPTEERRLAA